MKNLVFSRFNNGENIEDVYILKGEAIEREYKNGDEKIKLIYEDMILGNDPLGVVTYGDGVYDVYTQLVDEDEFFEASEAAFDLIKQNNSLYENNTMTFR